MAQIDTGKIAYCQIYPGIGIARIGNSPTEFFIGPETPGEVVAPVNGFKDKAGRIKRQAARFRLYAFDKDNVCLGELTADDKVDITWTVHLANAKASYNTFLGRFWQSQYPNFYKYNPNETPLRNQEIMDPAERQKLLVIDPGPRSIKPGGAPVEFDTGTIGPLPYSAHPLEGGNDPLAGSRDGWWNCPTKDRLPQPVKMSGKATVALGTLQVDDSGRLLVLGGYGRSESLIPDNPIGRLMDNNYYANNDYWFDDTSDGPVTAEVRIGGKAMEVRDGAWVIVAPPKFAPDFQMLTTLYDTAMETWEKKQNSGKLAARKVSFKNDIYPILARLDGITWLNKTAYEHHGATTNNEFAMVHSRLFALLHTKQKSEEVEAANARQHIFGRLRPPGLVPPTSQAADTPESRSFASYRFMPQMSGDGGEPQTPEDIPGTPLNLGQINDKVFDCATGKEWPVTEPTVPIPGGYYITWLTLSERQYANMNLWAKGEFDGDWGTGPADPVPLERLPVAQQPDALNRAAFEPCIGAPFYPGIEITYIATDPALWSGPCRIDAKTNSPGGITRHMALPWQADFSECNTNWWPTARPDDVVSEEELARVASSYAKGSLARDLSVRVPWARGIPTVSPAQDNAMVKAWSHFGFAVKREVNGETVYVESERSPYFGSSERDFFYYLMNIDAYPDFVSRAHQLVHQYLAQGRQNMQEADSEEVWSFFPFSQAAFDARMELIYANFVRDNQTTANPNLLSDNRTPGELASQGFQPATYQSSSNRATQAYQLLQMGPFNQLDGAWLRRAIPDGPVDDAGELLAQIRQDELGDGVTSQNHANVYTDLLKSLNFYLPDLYTRAYADDPRLLDEAFTQPCFLLAISQFDDEFLPEILGMTLYLEWSSIGLVSTVNVLKAFDINPLYYSLHVGIDNAAAGHGALAKRAVEIYLDRIRANEGPGPMQKAWERIWTGYVTFGTLGNLSDAISNHLTEMQSLDAQVQALIIRKAPFASQTHGEKTLGNTAINDWFLDPPGLMNQLQESGLIIPGQPEISPFFQLLSFNGPMYHVFTADEEQLLRNWCFALAHSKTPPMKTPLEAMDYVIDTLRQRQVGQSGHNVRITGPDPDTKNAKRTESVHWWFDKGNRALMAALANEENGWIVPFDSVASPIMSSLLAGNGPMASDFRAIVPDTGGKTCGNVLAHWIDLGCPLEEEKMVALMAARPARRPAPTVPHRIYRRKDGKVWGMGTPH